jgi:hypothetical protein
MVTKRMRNPLRWNLLLQTKIELSFLSYYYPTVIAQFFTLAIKNHRRWGKSFACCRFQHVFIVKSIFSQWAPGAPLLNSGLIRPQTTPYSFVSAIQHTLRARRWPRKLRALDLKLPSERWNHLAVSFRQRSFVNGYHRVVHIQVFYTDTNRPA